MSTHDSPAAQATEKVHPAQLHKDNTSHDLIEEVHKTMQANGFQNTLDKTMGPVDPETHSMLAGFSIDHEGTAQGPAGSRVSESAPEADSQRESSSKSLHGTEIIDTSHEPGVIGFAPLLDGTPGLRDLGTPLAPPEPGRFTDGPAVFENPMFDGIYGANDRPNIMLSAEWQGNAMPADAATPGFMATTTPETFEAPSAYNPPESDVPPPASPGSHDTSYPDTSAYPDDIDDSQPDN